ncbi:hypothetical protein D3C81_1826870 [compost metagenome]
MDNSFWAYLGHASRQRRGIAQVQLDAAKIASRQCLDPVGNPSLAIAEVVDYDHVVAGLQQRHGSVGADIACPAGHENCVGQNQTPVWWQIGCCPLA